MDKERGQFVTFIILFILFIFSIGFVIGMTIPHNFYSAVAFKAVILYIIVAIVLYIIEVINAVRHNRVE